MKRHSRAAGPLGLSVKRMRQTVRYIDQRAWGSVESLFQGGLQDLPVKPLQESCTQGGGSSEPAQGEHPQRGADGHSCFPEIRSCSVTYAA